MLSSRDVKVIEDAHSVGTLSNLTRFFNRVDERDAVRLQSHRYHLPSLSPGDFITVDGTTFRVLGVGFEQISKTSQGAGELIRATTRSAA